MTITKTLSNCSDPTWTWQHRDGQSPTKNDYKLIPKHGIPNVVENYGAVNWEALAKQGASIDHRPVSITVRIATLDAKKNTR